MGKWGKTSDYQEMSRLLVRSLGVGIFLEPRVTEAMGSTGGLVVF